MFGFRSDGKKLKKIDPIVRMTTYIMPHRYDASVQFKKGINCSKIDEFIKEKVEKENIKFSYMDIVIAGIVRMYALRPKLNRFVMNGNVYHRNNIQIAMTVKRKLTDDADETTIKVDFDGTESIYDVKRKMDEEIKKNQGLDKSNGTDKAAKLLLLLPNFLLKFAMMIIRFCDRHGMLPKAVLKVSPFHTSCFLTNMKSISCDYVYHHIYDFGTCGLFVAMGKEHKQPVVNRYTDEAEVAKILDLGIVIDERICDGLYYSHAIKVGSKFIENPYLLEEQLKPEDVLLDPDL